MASICPNCERPIKTGERIRIAILGIYHQRTQVLHAIEPHEEEWIEHENC